jgi:hypothetical protein
MTRRSWLAQSAHRTGAGPHADRRERRDSTRRQHDDRVLAEHLTLDAAYADAADHDARQYAAWLAAHPDLDLDAEADAAHEGSEREARERRP